MFDLRYCQTTLTDAVLREWERVRVTALIAATGTGKTEMYLHLATSLPGRVLVLVHRDYLISSPIERLARVGFTDAGIEKADQKSELGMFKNKIVFASVQSISRPKRLATFDPNDFDIIIIDEAHRGTATTYRRVLDHFLTNPRLKGLLLTATPNRKDGVALGNICDSVAGVYGPRQASQEGWIVPVKFFRRDVESLDFSNVKLKGGDLDPEQVQELLMQEKPLHEVCASLAEDRGPTIVFCPQVAVANAYAKLMNTRYRPDRAVMLYAESPDDQRERAGKMLANGELDYIFNVNLYTEGYDLPSLLRVVWAAPTASLVRYTQGVGRVFRPHSSLRGHLRGTFEESEQRRLLIAQSPKPFGIVVTYYPQNCKHVLCDPIDILGGEELSDKVKAVARQVQDETAKQAGGSKTEEDIETAKVFCELRDEALKELKGKARFTDQQFDPMNGQRHAASGNGTHDTMEAAPGWPAGEPATEKQCGWFRWKRIWMPTNVTKFRAVLVRDLIDLGVKPENAWRMGRKQAFAVREQMKAKAAAS